MHTFSASATKTKFLHGKNVQRETREKIKYVLCFSRTRVCARDVIKILKSKPEEPLEVLSSPGTRGTKFLPIYNFPAPSVFRLETSAVRRSKRYGVAWHKAKIAFVEKYSLISWFLAILGI